MTLAHVLWRRRLISMTVAVVVFLAGIGFLRTQQKVYESTSSIGLLPVSTNAGALPNYPNLVASLIPTYIQFASSKSFLDQVAATLPFATTAKDSGKVRAESVANAGVIRIVADLPNPIQASKLAGHATTVFIQQLGNNGILTFRLFDAAQIPTVPVAPKPMLVLGAAAVLAIILGLAGGLAWERLFGRLFGADELAELTGLRVLGAIPYERRLRHGVRLAAGQAGLERLSESMRSLRTSFLFAIKAERVRMVAITSLGLEEGKTTVAANLAVFAAEAGHQVVLIDGDIRKPRLHEVFGLGNQSGLTSTVLRGADPVSLAQGVPEVPGLRVVTAGPPLPQRRDEVSVYLQQLPRFARLGDVVIVDSPPLRADTEVRLLASSTQAVVLAVRSGASTPQQIAATLDLLKAVDAQVLGTVLTRATNPVDLRLASWPPPITPQPRGKPPGSVEASPAAPTGGLREGLPSPAGPPGHGP